MSDFEVLPVGTTLELRTVRALLCQLLDADDRNDPEKIRTLLQEVRSFYKIQTVEY